VNHFFAHPIWEIGWQATQSPIPFVECVDTHLKNSLKTQNWMFLIFFLELYLAAVEESRTSNIYSRINIGCIRVTGKSIASIVEAMVPIAGKTGKQLQ
jgi:hypothetical protein